MDKATASKSGKPETKPIRVTLKRSPIGTPGRHRIMLRSLGLRRIRQTAIHPDTPQVRGLIHKVGYLLEVRQP